MAKMSTSAIIKAITLGAAMLVFGAFATLAADWMNHSLAPGASGGAKPFDHPMIQSFLFFLGLSLTLPVYLIRCCIEKRSPRTLWEPTLLIPSSLDVTQTLLMIFCLLWIPASIWYEETRLKKLFASSRLTLSFFRVGKCSTRVF